MAWTARQGGGPVALALLVAIGGCAMARHTPPVSHRAVAYVVNWGSDTVTPIRLATNIPGRAIKVGAEPSAIAITPDGRTAYVANSVSDMVTPINLGTDAPGRPIRVGPGPQAIAITPNGRTAYVANGASNTVTPISLATNIPGSPIRVGWFPSAIAITPDGTTAYVVNLGSSQPPYNYDGSTPTANPGWLTPISTATNAPGQPFHAVTNPAAVAITPDGRTAFVGAIDFGVITAISLATRRPGRNVTVGGAGPYAMAITSDGTTAYVANFGTGTVIPISLATDTPGRPIKIGGQPSAIAITPDGRTAYVTDNATGTVIPISLATDTPGRPIKVGAYPRAIAITPSPAAKPSPAPSLPTASASPAPRALDVVSPTAVVHCISAAPQCQFQVGGQVTPGLTTGQEIVILVYPVHPAGAGWYIQWPPASLSHSGSWRQFPADLGAPAFPAHSGDTLRIEAILVTADAAYHGTPLRDISVAGRAITEPGQITDLVARSAVVRLTVMR